MRKLVGEFGLCLFFFLSSIPARCMHNLPNSSNYFSFSFTPNFYNRVKIENDPNNLLHSRMMMSSEFSLTYLHRSNKLNFRVGLNFGMIPQSISFKINPPINSPFYQTNNPNLILSDKFTNYVPANIYYAPSLELSKEFYILKNSSFEFGTGIRLYSFASRRVDLNYGTGIYIDSNNTNLVPLFNAYLSDTSESNLNWAIPVKAGINYVTKNCKLLSLNIIALFSTQKRLQGYYFFNNLGYNYSGNLSQGFNFIGMSFTYHFKI